MHSLLPFRRLVLAHEAAGLATCCLGEGGFCSFAFLWGMRSRYYFGVGGGTLPFLQFLREKHEGAFSAAVVASFGGSSSANVRDVLCVRRII